MFLVIRSMNYYCYYYHIYFLIEHPLAHIHFLLTLSRFVSVFVLVRGGLGVHFQSSNLGRYLISISIGPL